MKNSHKLNPQRATNRPKRPLQKKEGGERGKNKKKPEGERAAGKGKR